MVYGESYGPDQERAAINLSIAEVTRDSVDRLCSEMIDKTFTLLQSKLAEDADELEVYWAAGHPEGWTVGLYVAPDMVDAPMTDDAPQETLTMLLERKALADEPDDEASGDKIRVYVPVPRDYSYPDALEEDDQPTEIYIEFIPKEDKHDINVRYIIQRDETDPKQRYNIYQYESEADGGEQVIHDAMSDQVLRESFINRIPGDIELASQLIRRLANFDIIVQKFVASNPDNQPGPQNQ